MFLFISMWRTKVRCAPHRIYLLEANIKLTSAIQWPTIFLIFLLRYHFASLAVVIRRNCRNHFAKCVRRTAFQRMPAKFASLNRFIDLWRSLILLLDFQSIAGGASLSRTSYAQNGPHLFTKWNDTPFDTPLN